MTPGADAPALADTSVLIDFLRGHAPAVRLLTEERRRDRLHGSEVVRLEVLAGMRPREESATRALLGTIAWHPLDEHVAEEAGRLGRAWLPSHQGIDAADLAVAATVSLNGLRLLTVNVKHFPMVEGLAPPY